MIELYISCLVWTCWFRFCPLRLEEALLALRSVSSCRIMRLSIHTRHGLLSSKPGGAMGLSVCPRMKPVNRRSRSITAVHQYGHEVIVKQPYFAVCLLVTVRKELGDAKPTLSHWSTPRLALLPPFWISLSFPSDTALKAKNCGRR